MLHSNHFKQITLCLFIAALGFSFTTPAPTSQEAKHFFNWEKLGQKKVDYGLDRDEISVTAREGRFSAIKLMVKRSPINLHKVIVHYGNGTKQEVNVRDRIAAGGETRAIDIRGGKRIISKVVFWYDTKGIADKKGVVELWGRH